MGYSTISCRGIENKLLRLFTIHFNRALIFISGKTTRGIPRHIGLWAGFPSTRTQWKFSLIRPSIYFRKWDSKLSLFITSLFSPDSSKSSDQLKDLPSGSRLDVSISYRLKRIEERTEQTFRNCSRSQRSWKSEALRLGIEKLKKIKERVIVVNDNSTDNTNQILEIMPTVQMPKVIKNYGKWAGRAVGWGY